MRQDIAESLQRINREFYQTFAEAFADTRRRLQPGVMRAIRSVPRTSGVLDLGCGAGELARGLARRGHRGDYLGIDASPSMIRLACERSSAGWAGFRLADLVKDDWERELPRRYDRIFLLATLHHIPSDPIRKRLLTRIARALGPEGNLTLSVWNFEANPRMRGRVISWDTIGLTQDEVDPGDHLLDWRHGGLGLRYVHLFSEDGLMALAVSTGFKVAARYTSDGEGGRQAFYQVWEQKGDEEDPST